MELANSFPTLVIELSLCGYKFFKICPRQVVVRDFPGSCLFCSETLGGVWGEVWLTWGSLFLR